MKLDLNTPSAGLKQGWNGVLIGYTVRRCTLGVVLVAATARGVCAIELGKSTEVLVAGTRQRFPHALFQPIEALVETMQFKFMAFEQWLEAVLNIFEHLGSLQELPLDVQGTVFQQRVWKALQAIPIGHTESYTQVAQRIGQPKAARAVAQACAANQLAIVIPCHRVVRSDGSLSGYRWGAHLKAKLLAHELMFASKQLSPDDAVEIKSY